MQVDVLFVDPVCSRPYTNETLETESLGGSESSCIRLAEGFGSKGLKVLISQHWELPLHTSPNGVQYGGPHWALAAKAKNVIFVRARGIWEKFPDAAKFSWLHDASEQNHNNLNTWVDGMKANNVLAISVSDWHTSNVSRFAPGIPIQRIYSPMDEMCFQPARPYDPYQLCWLASAHKGLTEALTVFQKIRSREPRMKLAVFNPGYYDENVGQHPNVVFLPKQKRSTLRSVLSRSLCMFYPTSFEETFGLIAAESNALGVPVATYPVAALAESSVGPFAKDEQSLIDMVLDWSKNGRPKTAGQDRFRFSNIYPDWLNLLKL